MNLEVPTCLCVSAARRLSSIFPIIDKYVTEGSAASAGSGPAFGFLMVRCGYCGSILKAIEGFDFSSKITISPALDSISK
jgi:hypothetical protein